MASQNNEPASANRWLIIAGIFALAWALFWSVDALIMYLCLGGAAFSIAQFIIKRWDQKVPAQRGPVTSSEGLGNWIKKLQQANPADPAFRKTVVILILGSSISFVVLIIVLGVIFGDNDYDQVPNIQRARDFYYSNQYDSAAYYYSLAALDDPENPDIYVEHGNVYFITERFSDALSQYDKALALDARHSDAQYNKGLVYFEQKRYREAIRMTTNILYYDPSYYQAMLLVGDCHYNLNQPDSALRFYEGAYVNNYRSSQLTHMMAYLYDNRGNQQRAIELYRETLGLDSANADVYERLGELLPPQEANWYRTRAAQLKKGTDW
ncbi:MAG: tetratricopeptide repeat protein [Cyclobacteriaceae bacterium]|nr:tetratricopeptide repeat protein [Cyclobacteriaceae bacterium]UYN85979.1 MAG: tetratricopeptide repeat protein [Cyclobacteriaceae bacterium]